MAFVAEKEKIHLLIENEGSCNVATGGRTGRDLQAASRPSGWASTGIRRTPSARKCVFPDGYEALPKKRILNVQYKGKGIMPESKDKLDWKAILQALDKDGYKGCVGQETHIFDGTLIAAAHVSMKEMMRIVGEL